MSHSRIGNNEHAFVEDSKMASYGESHCFGDTSFDEDEILKRYDSATMALYHFKVKKLLAAEVTNENDFSHTIVDFSMSFGFEGSDYIGEMQTALQYVVLQAALILTISLPQYLSPVVVTPDSPLTTAYSFLVGLAALLHIATIILCTIFSGVMNMAYTNVDALVIRVQRNDVFVGVMVLNYSADLIVIIAMLVAGFDRDYLDGGLQLYAIVIVFGIIAAFLNLMGLGLERQNARSMFFYKKYCNFNGLLRDEIREKIYSKEEDPLIAKLQKLLQ